MAAKALLTKAVKVVKVEVAPPPSQEAMTAKKAMTPRVEKTGGGGGGHEASVAAVAAVGVAQQTLTKARRLDHRHRHAHVRRPATCLAILVSSHSTVFCETSYGILN
jgi:hypothetical protein